MDAPGQDPSAGAGRGARRRRSGTKGIKAIFAEAQFNEDLVRTIADETGATVVSDLYTDSVGDAPRGHLRGDDALERRPGRSRRSRAADPEIRRRDPDVPRGTRTIGRRPAETFGCCRCLGRAITPSRRRHGSDSAPSRPSRTDAATRGGSAMRVGRRHARRARRHRRPRRPRRDGPDPAGGEPAHRRSCARGSPPGRWASPPTCCSPSRWRSGLVLSHPRNTAEWRKTKQVFPWHEMLTVFTGAFLALHVVLLAIDPYAKVGVARRAGAGLLRLPAASPSAVGHRGPVRAALHGRHREVDPPAARRGGGSRPTGSRRWRSCSPGSTRPRRHRRRRADAPVPGDRPADPGGRRPSLVDREGPPAARRAGRPRRPCPSSGPCRRASRWRNPDVQGDARPARPAGRRARGDRRRHRRRRRHGAGRRPVARRGRPARRGARGHDHDQRRLRDRGRARRRPRRPDRRRRGPDLGPPGAR